MDDKTYKYLYNYIYQLKPIFDSSVNIDNLVKEVYNHLINDYENISNVGISLGKHTKEINDIFLTSKVKPRYSTEFSYAYINTNNLIEDILYKYRIENITRDEIEKIAFDIIFIAIVNNYDLNDFNTFKMNGFIDEYVSTYIIRKNSVNDGNEVLNELNRKDKLEKRIQMSSNFKRDLISAAALIGVLLAGNIVYNATRSIFEHVDKKIQEEKPKLNEMKTIEEVCSNMGYYDYENNEFIRS